MIVKLVEESSYSTLKAYWIKDKKIVEVSTSSHIKYIIDHPTDFGLTKEEIRVIYDRHSEKFSTEGNAREEIIRSVSKQGWIRARKYVSRSESYWSVQFNQWKYRKKAVKNFIEWAVYEEKVINQNESLTLLGYDDNYYKSYDFMTGGIKKFLSENKQIKRNINFGIDYWR